MTSLRLLPVFLVFFGAIVQAQDIPVQPPATMPFQPPTGDPAMAAMPRMNPAMLLRMRDRLAFELQQTQRTLGFIDPNDTQLTATLKEQQTELLNQLKSITTQLKEQGVPIDGEAAPPLPGAVTEAALPAVPKPLDPTLVPGGSPQPAADPNLLIQQRPTPGMAGVFPGTPMVHPALSPQTPFSIPRPGGVAPSDPGSTMPPGAPTGFDQDQAWANSPWAPQPSKELSELKQTVDSLRKELAEMKESVKALETQIQLLNRNFLLNQPAK